MDRRHPVVVPAVFLGSREIRSLLWVRTTVPAPRHPSQTPPVVVMVQALRGEPLFLAAAGTAVLFMAGLTVARFADLSAGARRAANRTCRDIGAAA